jgi:hypothetical protein
MLQDVVGIARRGLPLARVASPGWHAPIAALVMWLALAPVVQAQENIQLVEQEIKAGLLYNFMKYTDWPSDRAQQPNAPIMVCLLGGDPFAGRLQPLAGRTVNQHVIELRNLRTVDDAGMCSLLFIHADEKPQWPQLRAALAGKSMLTVSDFQGFAAAGGMIEFTRIENKIGVKIDTVAVMAAHLQVQDRLLKLANAVRGGAGAR